ncbi:MAG: DUF192 domain-containing protein [Desulfomonilaceae bacterium]|nr:DUF192 domain-containing protein [Desulfomonilaceae bacterium]
MISEHGMASLLRVRLRAAAVVFLSVITVAGAHGSCARAEDPVTSKEKPKLPQVTVTLGPLTILVDVANTDRSRTEGLLGWKDITEDRGMLLDFGVEREYAIHMQGMKFPIDAVWIDSAGEIKMIHHDIRPNSGLIYHSLFPCAYCLEIKAGVCRKYGIRIGHKVRFDAVAD